MKKLPVGYSDFPTLIKQDFVYADKTEFIYNLVKDANTYFISRPRQFGKTLLISTIHALLEGRRELFKGLWIDRSNYDWTPTPVVHLRMSQVQTQNYDKVEISLGRHLVSIAKTHKVILKPDTPASLLTTLFKALHKKYNSKIALLVDGYDTPITKHINDIPYANKIKEKLNNFYDAFKIIEKMRGFTFITGVLKFDKTAFFPSLDNIIDLTLNRKYAEICGFTNDEFDLLFTDYLEVMLPVFKSQKLLPEYSTNYDLKELIMDWYDGYSWDGKTRVLNPSIITSIFKNNALEHSFEKSDVITDAIKNVIKSGKIDFKFTDASKIITDNLNVIELSPKLKPIPLLFQTGYLTINKAKRKGTPLFYLEYPTREVKLMILPLLLSAKPFQDPIITLQHCENMMNSLLKMNRKHFQESFRLYLHHYKNIEPVAEEYFYQAVFQAAMLIGGASVDSDVYIDDDEMETHYRVKGGAEYVFI
ncbi:MAG: AAA family ATPase, partial [Deltaproteobacteria bacterium]|nr:AAA family ATPase [Deltaproteobacteria bacterium]